METLSDGFKELIAQKYQASAEKLSYCLNFEKPSLSQKILILHLLSLMYFKFGKINKGKQMLFMAVSLEKKNGQHQGSIHSSHQTALLEHVGGDIDQAAEYYMTTLNHLKKNQDYRSIVLCLRTLGEFFFFQGNILKTKQYWIQSISLSKKTHIPIENLTKEWLKLVTEIFP